MQIAFLTLFLGLVTGPQTVAVTAGAGIARVELVLDGSGVAELAQPPWIARLDFGPALLPHHLEARGLAADGSEVARAEQWVNLPRPPAEVDIVLEGAPGSRERTARLTWDNLTGQSPSQVQLSLDGVPLALDAQARAPLTVPRAGAAHVLAARLRFAGGLEAHKEIVLTGDYGSDVATELTAVPVRTRKPESKTLAERELQGRFLAGGQPVAVAAVERASPEVYLVRAGGAETMLVGRAIRLKLGAYVYGDFKPDTSIRFHFVSPIARLDRQGGTASEIFDISEGQTIAMLDRQAGSASAISGIRRGPTSPRFDMLRLLLAIHFAAQGRPQLADAVAVAGQHALARQTPRAVVLIAGQGDGVGDASRFSPAVVRGYLAASGVPLFVWSTARGSLRREDWGPIEDVSTPYGIRSAYDRLAEEILAQQIVWLHGRHLPQSITLAARTDPAGRADGLQLVTKPPAR